MLNTVIIQPPLVQLNTPYPSGAYLLSFFKDLYSSRNVQGEITWFDLSTDLFHEIFCREGIKTIFEKSRGKALKLADSFERQGDENSAFQLRRYVCQAEEWENWIDTIVQIVCGGGNPAVAAGTVRAKKKMFSGREFVHEFVRSAHVPRGNRVENYISTLGRDVQADDARIIASLSLADLADFITVAYDSEFSLVRYAERLASSVSTFDEILENLSAPVLVDFLKPLLERKIGSRSVSGCGSTTAGRGASTAGSVATTESSTGSVAASASTASATGSVEIGGLSDTMFCISVPFPGCFEAALFCAREIRKMFGDKALICLGGGYINTELRDVKEKRLFDFCDILSFDKGYGSYAEIFDIFGKCDYSCARTRKLLSAMKEPLYKIRHMADVELDEALGSSQGSSTGTIIAQKESDEEKEVFEREMLRKIIPDFSSIDFSRSPRLADDNNPMHRIWNDGSWLKAYMAYGCYWHRCAFCDTSLDYVKNYCGTEISYLYDGLYDQAEKTGVYGIHFVDEACPPLSLQRFALKNIASSEKKQPLTFWGNIRFEKVFSRDLADLLSKGGLTAVSGGIEIATGKGLDSVNKGTEIEHIVSAACAFKEAGILVHSYMIFGFWNQSEQDLIDSMETLRQMFAAGLIDSAFWHKFSLTKHSTVFREWKEGKHPELKPILKENSFAENDMKFQGEEKSEKYMQPLSSALEFWMKGEKLSKNVESYFPFRMPRPSVPNDFVDKLIARYEEKRDSAFTKEPDPKEKFVWIGGKPILRKYGKSLVLTWNYMGELLEVELPSNAGENVVSVLNEIRAGNYEIADSDKTLFSGERILEKLGRKTFFSLRGKGLCRLL